MSDTNLASSLIEAYSAKAELDKYSIAAIAEQYSIAAIAARYMRVPSPPAFQSLVEAAQIHAPELQALFGNAVRDFAAANELAALENAKARYLGKTGAITLQLRDLALLSSEEKKSRGADVNRSKIATEEALKARRDALASDALNAKLAAEAIDVTLPGRGRGQGGIHPVMKTWQRVEEIFASIGFDVADGPEIEADWFNFTALNNPPNHPDRKSVV